MDWSSIFNPGNLSGIIIGAIIAAFFYFKQKRRKEISWVKRSSQIITSTVSSFPNLKMLYKNEEIPDLTVTKIAFWNSGTDAVRASDIYEDRPIALVFDDQTKVLDVSIIPESNSNRKFDLCWMDSNAFIEIKRTCAEKQEGAVVQIIHTGDGSDTKLDGAIVEGKIKRTKAKKSDAFIESLKSATISTVAMVLAAIATVINNWHALAIELSSFICGLVIIIVTVYFVLGVFIILTRKIPKSLEKYFF